jgi:tetratricopeptide (TPR) repeat protein
VDDPMTINALVRDAALALPLAVLALLLILLVRRIRAKAAARRRDRVARVLDPSAAEVAAPSDETPPRDFAKDARDIATRIEAALAAGNMKPLAGLYLELALCHAKLGDEASRMSALRSAAAHGAQHGPHASHAAARFELAEAAYRLDDLTTACEQWQLARTAYLEDGQMERHASIEKRMRANGCPTDWVLTDF